MSLFFEHESIVDACAAYLGCDKSDLTAYDHSLDTIPVLIGWSGKDRLALHPEFIWLACAESVFCQLPVGPEALAHTYQKAQEPLKSAYTAHLLSAFGQWTAALDECLEAIHRPDWVSVRFRVGRLEAFSERRWPTLYEGVLAQLHRGVDARRLASADKLLREIRFHAQQTVSAFECQPLTCWIEEPLVSLVAEAEDLACYVAEGLAKRDEFRRAINRDGWCLRLETECAAAQARLAEVWDPDEATSNVFGQSLERIRKALSEIRKKLAAPPSEFESWRYLLAEIVCGLVDLAAATGDGRKRLAHLVQMGREARI